MFLEFQVFKIGQKLHVLLMVENFREHRRQYEGCGEKIMQNGGEEGKKWRCNQKREC